MKIVLMLCVALMTCNIKTPTKFSEEALNDRFLTLVGESVPFRQILEEQKENKILIDIWATWCKDCLVGIPKVKALQAQFPEVKFVFLSLDKDVDKWKFGIEKYNLKGEHYYMQSGWKGAFGKFVNLDWIPRYMVIDENGEIIHFKAIEADDNELIKALQ